MGKIGNAIGGFRGFLNEVHVELTKCTWPTRPELVGSTLVVIVSCIILSVFVGFSDFALLKILKLIVS